MAGTFGAGYAWNSPWDDSDRGERFLTRLLARKPSVDEEAEAHVRWGGPSDFLLTLRGGPRYIPVVEIINWPEDRDGEEEEEPQPILEWTEVPGTRETSDVRVENPDDADQYVIVQRAEKVLFHTHEGEYIRLNFANEEGN